MKTIRERRHRDAIAQLDRAIGQRDDTIARLVKLEAKVKGLRRQIVRYEKIAAQPATRPSSALLVPPTVEIAPLPPAIMAELTKETAADDLGIPDFLARKREGDRKDAEAKAKLLAELAESKKGKARGRIEKMKAVQRGDTSRMPLTGKAALEAIRQG